MNITLLLELKREWRWYRGEDGKAGRLRHAVVVLVDHLQRALVIYYHIEGNY